MFWKTFWNIFCVGLLCFPIPLGVLWFLAYIYRKNLGLPDWLSGILAQGIISGTNIERGQATEDDYYFIIIVTLILVAIFSCLIAYLISA